MTCSSSPTPTFPANSTQGAVFRTTQITRNECNLAPPTCRRQPYFRPLLTRGKEYSLAHLARQRQVDAALAQNPEDPNEIIVNVSLVILCTSLNPRIFPSTLPPLGTRYHWLSKTIHISKYKFLIEHTKTHWPEIPSTVGALVTESLMMVEWSIEATLELLSSSHWPSKYLGVFCTQTHPINISKTATI